MMFQLHACGGPRYKLRYRHHTWRVYRRLGSRLALIGQRDGYSNLHEAHKAIEGDIASLKAATNEGEAIGRLQ